MQVTLHHPVYGWAVGRVNDVSLSGALLQLSGRSLPSHTPVALVFHVDTPSGVEQLALPAVVVRSEEGRVAVAFLEHDEIAMRRLRSLIDVARAAWGSGDAPGTSARIA